MALESESVEAAVRTIPRHAQEVLSAGEVRTVVEGLGGETNIAALCRREGIPTHLYYHWGKQFLEAGK